MPMLEKRVIKAKDIINNIRAGMTNSELMEKYKLSPKGLQSIFRKLEAVKAIRFSELYGRCPSYDDTADVDQTRKELRHYIDVPLTVYGAAHPQIKGAAREISQTGLGTKGIRASVGETKTLVISPEKLFLIDPFAFDAVCRWTRREGANREHVAGFEIVAISEEGSARLRELIGRLSLLEG